MLLPAAISLSTSRSRGLSTGPSGSARLRISPTSPAARLGATTSRPLAQSSTAFTSSDLLDSLGRNPAAPSWSARKTIADSSCAETKSTRVGSSSRSTAAATSAPSMPGMRKSSRATWGRWVRIASKPRAPTGHRRPRRPPRSSRWTRVRARRRRGTSGGRHRPPRAPFRWSALSSRLPAWHSVTRICAEIRFRYVDG